MKQEEKAQAYDMVREKIALRFGSNVADEIFSQFEMSEDERIRKELISYITQINYDNSHTWNGINLNVFIAWLEKRKKEEPSIADIVDEHYWEMLGDEKQGEQKSQGKSALEAINEEKVDNRNYVKPTDKIEPNFKVGDWIINTITNEIEQVIELTNYEYICSGHLIISFNNQHLLKRWTIEDAKDGDVLVCPKYASDIIPNIFIFKNIEVKDNDVYCHCSFSKAFITGGYIANADPINTDFYPATQEQRDLLFQKMKEAGYEWDAEKKKLKKIKQKPYPETLDEAIELYYYTYGNDKGGFDHLSLEKFKGIVKMFVDDYGMQNSAWSEDDEKGLSDALWAIEQAKTIAKDENDMGNLWYAERFLKSLKDRVQPQPKQEWSEEDKGKTPNDNQFTPEQAGVLDKHIDKFLEQKAADKVVPKFKVGDWVVCNNGPHHIFQVIERSWPNAKYRNIDGAEIFLNVNTLDKQYHLWTIQDAKDGDVLACESGWTCIFKTLVNDETFSSYCFMDKTKWFCETGSECHTLNAEFMKAYNGEIKPATKEQRKLLFQKMEEAGWEWDTYKKRIKPLENRF